MTSTPPKIDLDRLKHAIPIMALAESLGLEIRGRQARCYNGQAHSHNDKNFSLGLDTHRNRYKCFTCGERGSVIDLYKAVKGIDLSQAIKELAEMTGLTPLSDQPRYKPYRDTQRVINEPAGDYNRIYEELVLACGGLDQESKAYLTGATRGLTEETLNRFLLCSVKDYQKTDKYLKAKFSKDELKQAGVIGEKGNLLFYKHKVIIPFISGGRITFLQGRRLDEAPPKYLHISRPVPLFNADILSRLKSGDKVYICEGVFDAMMLEQNGYNAVAILGVNNFKPETAGLFKGLKIVLSLDNDEAGQRATNELAKMFLIKGQAVKSKQLPKGIKDISEYFINYEKL